MSLLVQKTLHDVAKALPEMEIAKAGLERQRRVIGLLDEVGLKDGFNALRPLRQVEVIQAIDTKLSRGEEVSPQILQNLIHEELG